MNKILIIVVSALSALCLQGEQMLYPIMITPTVSHPPILPPEVTLLNFIPPTTFADQWDNWNSPVATLDHYAVARLLQEANQASFLPFKKTILTTLTTCAAVWGKIRSNPDYTIFPSTGAQDCYARVTLSNPTSLFQRLTQRRNSGTVTFFTAGHQTIESNRPVQGPLCLHERLIASLTVALGLGLTYYGSLK